VTWPTDSSTGCSATVRAVEIHKLSIGYGGVGPDSRLSLSGPMMMLR